MEGGLGGYKIYYDTTPSRAGNVVDMQDPGAASYRLYIGDSANNGPGDSGSNSRLTIFYISISAYNTGLHESARSDEIDIALPPDDPYYNSSGSWGQPYGDLWGVRKIRALEAWKAVTGAQEIVIAIVDTGIDYNHEDIRGSVWTNASEIPGNGVDDDDNGFIDDVRGWDFVNVDNDPLDDNGHGTHVAGIAAAEGNNATGIAGLAWGCRVMVLKGLDEYGYGDSVGLAEAIRYAAFKGAKVINNSWGSSMRSDLIKDAVEYAYSLDCVVVAAAGNDRSVSEFFPAAYEKVIAVGATGYNDAKAGFSNFGSWVDVFAPGEDILSLRAVGTEMGQPLNDFYTRADGTSMASPFVAGLSALILSRNPDFTPFETASILRASCHDIGETDWDLETSYGRIDAAKACSLDRAPDLRASITGPEYEQPVKEDTASIIGSAGGEDFSSYRLEYGFGMFPDAWTEIASGTGRVEEAELGLWDVSGLGDGMLTIKLTVLGGNESEKRTFVRRVILARSEKDGWPLKLPGRITSSPAVADVDKDRMKDIAIGVMGEGFYDSLYYLLDHEGLVKSGWPAQTESWNDNSPLLADLDNDGYSEVITLSLENPGIETYVWDYMGNLRDGWPKDSIGSSLGMTFGFIYFRSSAPVVYDVNGDGYPDIISQDLGSSLFVYNRDGSLIEGWPAETGLSGYSWASTKDSVPALLPGAHPGNCDIFIPMQINEYDADRGRYEYSAKVFGFHSDGSWIDGWPIDLPIDYMYEVSSASCDFDNDGDREMVFAVYGSYLNNDRIVITVLNEDGTSPATWPKVIEGGDINFPNLALADISGSQAPEIIATYDRENLVVIDVYNLDGTRAPGWPKELPDTKYISYPVVGDINDDGSPEIVVSVADDQDVNGIPRGAMQEACVEGSSTQSSRSYTSARGSEALDGVYCKGCSGASECSPYYTGRLYAFKGDGTVADGWPITTGFAAYAPAIDDLDADGTLELILADYNGWIHVWELGAHDPNLIDWPALRKDPHHTAIH